MKILKNNSEVIFEFISLADFRKLGRNTMYDLLLYIYNGLDIKSKDNYTIDDLGEDMKVFKFKLINQFPALSNYKFIKLWELVVFFLHAIFDEGMIDDLLIIPISANIEINKNVKKIIVG